MRPQVNSPNQPAYAGGGRKSLIRRPRFIAEQARNARGPLGRLVAFIMAKETWTQNQRAIAALGVRDGDQVLDVGCGHGRSLAALAALTPAGAVTGVDPSSLMVQIAAERNRELVRAGRVTTVVAPVEALPFSDSAFDRILCVHVVYFWPDLQAAVSEMARVLTPGGRIALLFRDANAPGAEAFPSEIYNFRNVDEVEAAFLSAGLVVEATSSVGGCNLTVARRSA